MNDDDEKNKNKSFRDPLIEVAGKIHQEKRKKIRMLYPK